MQSEVWPKNHKTITWGLRKHRVRDAMLPDMKFI